MKKTNTKTKSPAPATNGMKPTKKKASVETSLRPTAARLVATLETPAPVAPAAAIKAVPPARVQTKIIAQADVGFGTALYVRGDGAGLSWNQGLRMECIANDRWQITLAETSRPVAFKLLLNDTTWCTGPDSVVESGQTATVTPEFA